MGIECGSPLASNRIDHRRWVDRNKDSDEKNFEPLAPLIPFSYDSISLLTPSLSPPGRGEG